jgi:hypothetical protein
VPYDNNNNERNNEIFFTQRLKAGKRRTYFFDVRSTKGNDYFITLTESKKRFDDNGYERHKIYIYKEDFNKFHKALGEAINHVKTELLPDFDFDAFNHEYPEGEEGEQYIPSFSQSTTSEVIPTLTESVIPNNSDIEVDKW